MRQYFNPRSPHGERPSFPISDTATLKFQSTLPAWERRGWQLAAVRNGVFQSTLPHGERPPTIPLNRRDDAISIHAPAWGATTLSSSRRMVSSYFNPRPRMGSDTSVSFLSVDRDLFQSTLPHGERRKRRRRIRHTTIHFNPRSRMGSDKYPQVCLSVRTYFNPRSRMESDSTSRARPSWKSNFNPRSRMGSDCRVWPRL